MQKRCREKQKQPVLKWQIARCKVMHLMSGCAASSESYINDLGLSGHAKSDLLSKVVRFGGVQIHRGERKVTQTGSGKKYGWRLRDKFS